MKNIKENIVNIIVVPLDVLIEKSDIKKVIINITKKGSNLYVAYKKSAIMKNIKKNMVNILVVLWEIMI
jgi:hypothetical protein